MLLRDIISLTLGASDTLCKTNIAVKTRRGLPYSILHGFQRRRLGSGGNSFNLASRARLDARSHDENPPARSIIRY